MVVGAMDGGGGAGAPRKRGLHGDLESATDVAGSEEIAEGGEGEEDVVEEFWNG